MQKNRTWCRKGKILEVGCRYKKKNKVDDTYKKFNDGRFRLCQELRTTVYTLDNIPLRRTMIRMLLQREDKIAENCNG